MTQLKRRLFATATAGMVCLSAFFVPVMTTNAYAAENTVKFDETDVLEDLQSMDGFSLAQYPYYESVKPEMRVIDFVEYCYDYRANMRDNYGLYLYVYNPNAQNIVTDSEKNKVQIAVAYDSDPITEKSNALTYEKFDLQFCSESWGAGVNKLFYKFKVIDHESADGKTIAERVNSMDRRYDISGIELLTEGNRNATDYKVATSYHFSGFAEGYGSGGAGTALRRNSLETLEISLTHKNAAGKEIPNASSYRFPYINQNGPGHQNQLDSVYFAVPKEFNENYGELYRVKCCWDEQKTTPIIVTKDGDVYSWVNQKLGQKDGVTDLLGIFDNFSSSPEIPGLSFLTSPPSCIADWGWGYQHRNFYEEGHSDEETNGWVGSIGGVLVDDDEAPGYAFKSDKSNVKDTDITSAEMKKWIAAHGNADYLFSDSVDEGRTKGYQEHTFTADEPFDMLTFNQTASGWDKFCLDWEAFWTGKSWDFGPEQQAPVEPIRLVSNADFTGADAADAENLYVHTEDFDEFESFYNANKATKNVFLLRFAVTDYYSNMQTVLTGATWYDPSTWQTGTKDRSSTYMARETVFLDFDIIELTFLRDTTETIIPVVASPIDVVGGVSSPIEEDGIAWGKIIVAILAVILLVVLLWPIMPYIIRAILWVILLPFKAIAALCKAISNSVKKRRRKKEEQAHQQAEKPPKA